MPRVAAMIMAMPRSGATTAVRSGIAAPTANEPAEAWLSFDSSHHHHHRAHKKK
jgi:hypothetical protein